MEEIILKIMQTERLILRPLAIDDAEEVFEWVSDPIVNRYMPYPLHVNVQQTKDWITTLANSNEFCFGLKDTGKLVGAGSIKYREEFEAFELGYNLNRKFWGAGYATEAAKGMIQWAYENAFILCSASKKYKRTGINGFLLLLMLK